MRVNDADFMQAANKDGFTIHLKCQPPNNPNLNMLNLNSFRAIQLIQHQQSSRNILELVSIVNYAYI